MADPQDSVDFSWSPTRDAQDGAPARRGPAGRPWLSIYFECCHAYARIYKSRDGRSYAGACPRCGARLEVPVGPGGTTQRAFRAG
ncbi:MAG: hypothetical protein ACF8QF_05715 [Phycisphaerales bacterium]